MSLKCNNCDWPISPSTPETEWYRPLLHPSATSRNLWTSTSAFVVAYTLQRRLTVDIVAGQHCQTRSPHPCQPDVCPCCCALRYSVARWLKYCNNLGALLRKPVISAVISISPVANARHCVDRESLCEGQYASDCVTGQRVNLACYVDRGETFDWFVVSALGSSSGGFGHSLPRFRNLSHRCDNRNALYYTIRDSIEVYNILWQLNAN